MKNIKPFSRAFYEANGLQKINHEKKYQEHPYLVHEGNAIFNALTGEAVMLDGYIGNEDELIKRWYLVPDDVNVLELADNAYKNYQSPSNAHYTIFTTTKCNACCQYCYEAGIEEDFMSISTAYKVAEYIYTKEKRLSTVELRWFGGEPLLNKEVINLICENMKGHGINHVSSMSSNGDLFNTITDDEIKLWNLVNVQFTIDDVGEKYDEIKGLPAGAYERLKETIKRLTAVGTTVTIRIHLDPLKGPEVCDRIIEDFKDFQNTYMYVAMLYDTEVSKENYDQMLALESKMIKYGLSKADFPNMGRGFYCMADRKGAKCVISDGSFSPCEHYISEYIYGSVDSDEVDEKIVEEWKEKRKAELKCTDCELYPTCDLLAMCPATGKCDEGYAYYQKERIKRALRVLMTEDQNE